MHDERVSNSPHPTLTGRTRRSSCPQLKKRRPGPPVKTRHPNPIQPKLIATRLPDHQLHWGQRVFVMVGHQQTTALWRLWTKKLLRWQEIRASRAAWGASSARCFSHYSLIKRGDVLAELPRYKIKLDFYFGCCSRSAETGESCFDASDIYHGRGT